MGFFSMLQFVIVRVRTKNYLEIFIFLMSMRHIHVVVFTTLRKVDIQTLVPRAGRGSRSRVDFKKSIQ